MMSYFIVAHCTFMTNFSSTLTFRSFLPGFLSFENEFIAEPYELWIMDGEIPGW